LKVSTTADSYRPAGTEVIAAQKLIIISSAQLAQKTHVVRCQVLLVDGQTKFLIFFQILECYSGNGI